MSNNKPTIIYGAPIIATKDAAWIDRHLKNTQLIPGAVWLLPDDAILIVPPETQQEGEDVPA